VTTRWVNMGALRLAMNVSISGPNIENLHEMEYEDTSMMDPTDLSGSLLWTEGQTSVLISTSVSDNDGGCAEDSARNPAIQIQLKDIIGCSLDSSSSVPVFDRFGKQSSPCRCIKFNYHSNFYIFKQFDDTWV